MSSTVICTPVKELDIAQFPLTGRQFVEASAGTGKTFAMAHFYLRLVLEKSLAVEQILVLSFTRAATDELKQRIREILIRARNLLNGFTQVTEKDQLIIRILQAVDPEDAKRRLLAALLGFDGAAIFTIHGFCQRLLRDWAFETGQPLEVELTGDELPVLIALAEDFWRQQLTKIPEKLARRIVDQYWSPEKLADDLKTYLGREWEGGIKNPPNSVAIEKLEQQFSKLRETAFAQFDCEKLIHLLTSGHLDAKTYNASKIPEICDRWQSYFQQLSDHDLLDRLLKSEDKFELFTVNKLKSTTRKNGKTPEHPFFNSATEFLATANLLKEALAQRINTLIYELFLFLEQQRSQRLRESRQVSFNELPNAVVRALRNGQQGQQWAKQLREQFPAALIDEFQDTDTLQWAILQAIYPQKSFLDQSFSSTLICVGDPKQAIYSFRGADIFTYLKASRTAQIHSQTQNFRASPSLIRALNALFNCSETPFLNPEIRFTPIEVGQKPDPSHLSPETPALVVWPVPKESNKTEHDKQIAQGIAAYLVEQFNAGAQGKAAIVEKGQRQPLSPKHFAVLVQTHHQGNIIYNALIQRNIPVVMRTRESVFATPQARAARRLLTAILDHRNESAVAAALLEEPFSWSLDTLDAARNHETTWERKIQQFTDYSTLWRDQGPLSLWRRVAHDTDFQAHCLHRSDGERSLTNWLHLMELLQKQYTQQHLSPATLLAWFIGVIQRPPKEDSTDDLLRLESDAERVKIVTIHGSKGLEYPIVICPFLARESGQSRSHGIAPKVYHDDHNQAAVVDFRGDAANDEKMQQEALEEAQRLLYVALTRAQYRCCLVWQEPDSPSSKKSAPKSKKADLTDSDTAENAPLAYSPLARLLGGNINNFNGLEIWQRLAEQTQNAISLCPLPTHNRRWSPPADAAPSTPPRPLPTLRPPQRGWRFASFSSLQEQRGVETHTAVIDDWGKTVVQTLDLHGFPRGAQAGRCLHAILQHALPDAQLANRRLIERQLRLVGFDAERWATPLEQLLNDLFSTPLGRHQGTLGQLTPADHQAEMAFTYPFQQMTAVRWQQILKRHHIDENLPEFELRDGFLRGFIDLVAKIDGQFFVIDYKSNWLGENIQSYGPDALKQAMNSGGYHFQALLYVVALHRHLRLRLPHYSPTEHLGGFCYLFLRGLNGRGTGVYKQAVSAELLCELETSLSR